MALAAPAAKCRKPYTYVKLCDLRPGSNSVNVMGVVVLFKPPYKSKGSDYTCTVEIVDEGCEQTPVPIIFFNRDIDKLPKTCNIGNVLCTRRVDIAEFQQRLQGKCRNYCSWLIWDGEREGRRGPMVTSDGVSWDPDEMARADQLINWSLSLGSDPQPSSSHHTSPIMPSPVKMSTLKSITDITLTDKKIDFVGVVKKVSVPQKSRGPDFFISVTLIDETSSPEGFTFTFFNPIEDQLPKLGDPGSVAFLSNMNITEYEGNLLGRGHQRSRVIRFTLQPDGDMKSTSDANLPTSVRERAKALLEWVVSSQPLLSSLEDSELDSQSQAPPLANHSVPSQSDSDLNFVPPTFLTLMLHPTWEISSLKDVQACQNVPSCFRVRVKVLQVLHSLNNCCQLRCPECKYKFPLTQTAGTECDSCTNRDKASSPKLRFMYCLSLLISDATATCQAHLSDTGADDFFRDLLPANLHESPTTRESLLKILTTLTGRQDPFLPIQSPSLADKSKPWIDCCVQSYPSCKGTQVRIMDTWFVKKVW